MIERETFLPSSSSTQIDNKTKQKDLIHLYSQLRGKSSNIMVSAVNKSALKGSQIGTELVC